jgi:5,10-methylenetetrahydromethanopterin reductase
MSALPKISIRVDGSMTPMECVEYAKTADAGEFSGVWFAENAFARGILPAAAACAVATKRLRINAGVFNPFSRHPAMMAMEIGALDELSGGRAALSIGAGIMSATQKMGLNPEKPLLALRDTIEIVRALLRGEEADHVGPSFSAKKIRLDYRPRSDIPIFLAGRGNLTVKLAGEAADGLIVSNMCSVQFAGRVAELMQSSRIASGRTGFGEVIQFMPCSVSHDAGEAMKAAKSIVGDMLPRFWALGQKLGSAKEALLAGIGVDEAGLSKIARRLSDGEDPAIVLDDGLTTAFSLAGTPEDCLSLARHYKAAGVTEIALTFNGPTAIEEILALGKAIADEKSV